MSAQDFSEDITNGSFEMQNDDQMGDNSQGDNSGVNSQHSNGAEPMEHSYRDSGSIDHSRDDDRKLFIGGLSWETTEKDLREYFSKFGSIESLTLKTDPTTGRSRGFAFIVFTENSSLDQVVGGGDHIINGKKVDPKKAKARHGKIFVGGLIQEITDADIKTYFSQFGNVVELEMPIDKIKNQRKGFCFVTFDNEQIVQELLKTPKQTICGKEVDVKKAQPAQNKGGMMSWGPTGMGMRGGYRGGGATGTSRGGRGGGVRGAGRTDWGGWGGAGSYNTAYGSYAPTDAYGTGYDYYAGYGGSAYGGYGDSYAGYGSYDAYGYDYDTTSTRGSTRGRGTSSRD